MSDFKMKNCGVRKNTSTHIGIVKYVIMASIFMGISSGCQSSKTAAAAKIYNPRINAADFTVNIDNPYYSLKPGTTFVYKSKTDEGTEINKVAVTSKTRKVMGVTVRIVWDRVWLNNKLKEETYDWFAQDKEGNVWYFGEDSKEYERGKPVNTEGSWEAGIDGALPGIVMKATKNLQVNKPYRQEYKKGEAEDMAEVVGLYEKVTVPYGSFDKCLKTKDWSPLEPEVMEHKYYSTATGSVVLETEVGNKTRVELIDIRVSRR